MIGIDKIKELRDETGHSISKCKEVLEESGGDSEKARELLREKGTLAAQKKASRQFGANVVQSYIHNTNKIGAMVELLCETDFVAKNEEFISLAREIAMHCAAFQPQYLSRDSVDEEQMKMVVSELEGSIEDGKTGEMRDKILQGKLDSKMKEVILLEQAFLKDDTRTIQSLIDEATQKFGERIEVSRFIVMSA